jgi:hemolysin activation/secretion protein
MLDDVKHYDIVSLDTLERAMLIINDTPGVQVTRADVMPGEKVGTSDFAVDTKATARYNGYLMLDNYGSVYTGKNRLSFNVDDNSITGRGDKLSVSGLGTEGTGLLNGRVGYSLPLASNGLRGEIAYSHTRYQLGGIYTLLNANGTADGVDATLTYPIRRIRAQTIEASFNASRMNLEDKILSTNTVTPKTTITATAGLSIRDERRVLGFDGLTQASVKWVYGHLNINDPTALANDAAGAKTQGDFNKLAIEVSRVSLLPKNFSLTTALKIQQTFNGKNLDGSQRMAVSGSNGVMAYPSGELIGSDATFVRMELSRPLPAAGMLQSNWLAFADWGTARAATPLLTDVNRQISDMGLGWNASYKGAVIRAYLAHRLQGAVPLSEPYPRDKFLMQAGWVF